MVHETRVVARYAETDQMGLVHHSVAIVWFEQARTELMAALGMPYGEMERQGHLMPVVEVGVRYRSGARFEDRIRVETRVTKVSGARIRFDYRAIHDGEDRLLYEGHTVLGCTDRDGRAVRIPAEVRRLATEALEAE